MFTWLKFIFNNKGFISINKDPDPADTDKGGPEANPPESTSTQVDHTPAETPPAYTPPEINMAEALPPEHRNKEYFKDITFEKMVNEFVGLQTKLGERPAVGVPNADATPEQLDAFYNSLRPANLDEYQIPETDFSKDKGRDETFQKSMKEVFYKAGVSQRQVNILTKEYDGLMAQMLEQGEEADKKFDEKITEVFKDNREQALTRAKDLMRENIPEEFKPLLENIPNSALLLLTTTLNGVYDKYIKEDGVGTQASVATADPIALRAEAMKIMQSAEFKDFRNPGYDAAQDKVKQIYKQIAEIQNQTLGTKK